MNDLVLLMESGTVDPLVDHPADFHVFHQFLEHCKTLPPFTTSVCWPLTEVALIGATEEQSAQMRWPCVAMVERKR